MIESEENLAKEKITVGERIFWRQRVLRRMDTSNTRVL